MRAGEARERGEQRGEEGGRAQGGSWASSREEVESVHAQGVTAVEQVVSYHPQDPIYSGSGGGVSEFGETNRSGGGTPMGLESAVEGFHRPDLGRHLLATHREWGASGMSSAGHPFYASSNTNVSEESTAEREGE